MRGTAASGSISYRGCRVACGHCWLKTNRTPSFSARSIRGKDIASPVSCALHVSSPACSLAKCSKPETRDPSTDKRRYLPCLWLVLRSDGYDAVSAVPNYRESLRLNLDPEVSVCLNLEERNTLSFVGTLAIWKFGRKSKKSMAVIIQN